MYDSHRMNFGDEKDLVDEHFSSLALAHHTLLTYLVLYPSISFYLQLVRLYLCKK